jgi:hypothetical protein
MCLLISKQHIQRAQSFGVCDAQCVSCRQAQDDPTEEMFQPISARILEFNKPFLQERNFFFLGQIAAQNSMVATVFFWIRITLKPDSAPFVHALQICWFNQMSSSGMMQNHVSSGIKLSYEKLRNVVNS